MSRSFLYVADRCGCLSSEEPGEEGLDVENWVFGPFCVWCRQSAVLFFGVWRLVFPAPFIEGTVLSLVYVLGSFLVN